MTLSDRNLLIRWAFLFESQSRRPSETNLCALFWRCMLLTPLKLTGIAGVGVVVSVFIISALDIGWKNVLLALGIAATMGGVIGLTVWAGTSREVRAAVVASPLGQAVAYGKANYCPAITIRRAS